jgi:hypothetical protein
LGIVKRSLRRYRSIGNGNQGFAGALFIFMLFVFMVPMYMLLLDVGRNVIAKESVQAANDTAVLAGLQQVKKITDTTGDYGQSSSWHFEVIQPQALAAAQATFQKNLDNLKIENHLKATLLEAQPTFNFPDTQSMDGNLPFKIGMEDFNKANQVLNPSITPSPDWFSNSLSKSVIGKPNFP